MKYAGEICRHYCLASERGTKSVTLKWRKYVAAGGYLIYGSKGGAGSKMKLLKTIKGKKKALINSVAAHTVTHDGKTTAVRAVKVNKTSVSVKKGKTFQIKASETKENSKKKIDHHRDICYESSNKKVATVDKNGKVKGVKKGKAIETV